MEFAITYIVICFLIAYFASARGRSGLAWFVLTLLTTPLVTIVILALTDDLSKKDKPHPNTHIKCPDCAELIKKEARVCKHCGCKLIPQS